MFAEQSLTAIETTSVNQIRIASCVALHGRLGIAGSARALGVADMTDIGA
jgi:hypothetical protein